MFGFIEKRIKKDVDSLTPEQREDLLGTLLVSKAMNNERLTASIRFRRDFPGATFLPISGDITDIYRPVPTFEYFDPTKFGKAVDNLLEDRTESSEPTE